MYGICQWQSLGAGPIPGAQDTGKVLPVVHMKHFIRDNGALLKFLETSKRPSPDFPGAARTMLD